MTHNSIDYDLWHKLDKTMEVGEDGPYVIIIGNFTDGYKVYGPFGTYETAYEWVDNIGESAQTAWVTLLWAPKGREIPYLPEQL